MGDKIISRHLSNLYDMLLQENICRLIEPYATVETAHIATLMQLPVHKIEEKLSQARLGFGLGLGFRDWVGRWVGVEVGVRGWVYVWVRTWLRFGLGLGLGLGWDSGVC